MRNKTFWMFAILSFAFLGTLVGYTALIASVRTEFDLGLYNWTTGGASLILFAGTVIFGSLAGKSRSNSPSRFIPTGEYTVLVTHAFRKRNNTQMVCFGLIHLGGRFENAAFYNVPWAWLKEHKQLAESTLRCERIMGNPVISIPFSLYQSLSNDVNKLPLFKNGGKVTVSHDATQASEAANA